MENNLINSEAYQTMASAYKDIVGNDVADKVDFKDLVEEGKKEIEEPNESKGTQSVFDDIAKYNDFRKKSQKEQLFDQVYNNEQLAFYQEQKRFMNHNERRRLKSTIKRMLKHKEIYLDSVGKIHIRKQPSNLRNN